MDSSASGGVVFELLRAITCLVLFLLSYVYADNSTALRSPQFCFRVAPSSMCLEPLEYPLEFAYLSSHSCGYPGLEVDCDDQSGERPFINISNHIYHVLDVDYESKHIRLVDIDVEGSGGGCPQPKRNLSIPSSPSWVKYEFPIPLYYVYIFYNCSSVPVDAEKHLLCSKQDDTNTPPSYAVETRDRERFDWYGNCAQNVVLPVLYSSGLLNYSDAIKRGFWMHWSATDWCEDCERSGGRCWSNSMATGCACSNGKSYNTTCPVLTPPPPPPPHHKGVPPTPPPTPSTALKSQHRKDGLSIGLKIVIGVRVDDTLAVWNREIQNEEIR